MSFVCSMLSISAGDLRYPWHEWYNERYEKGQPKDLELPLFSSSFDNQTINFKDVFAQLAANKNEEMYIVACYEKRDTIFLQIAGISPLRLYEIFENHIAGVYIEHGSRKVPFFIISTQFDPQARVMKMFIRENETVTICWDYKAHKREFTFYGFDSVTSFIYYYKDKQWHPKLLLYNSKDLLKKDTD